MGDSTYYYDLAQADATAYGVPAAVETTLIGAESSYNPNAYNPATGAYGLGQILSSTAANPGYGIEPVDPSNPVASLNFAAQYLAAAYQQLGSWSQAVSAYFNGIGAQAANPGLTYPNSAVQAAAAQADAANGTSTASSSGSQTTPNAEASSEGSGCTGWLSTPVACITATLTELGFVLLALVVIGAGLFLLRNRGGT